ncbi:VCBS repeat-containing protein [Streptomyces sp. ISL-43]|uniref:FG-GAP repeat domain-containing protein n=1 Tax=Streptomyces sp. ISL-43 TaxID=2819183 RepID=UPI001BEAC2CA|nr:VCBS repeat-containing protein [Streptomyces sp. ISL-43]MBT2452134.1 VCBS repeat-containing protein [Streptomyces sp. ISL-43]
MPRSLTTLFALLLPLTSVALLAEPGTATAAETTPAGSTAGAQKSASEVKAFTLAKESGERVEIIDRRTEYAETYANPDGSLTQKQFTLPVWTRHDSIWRRTDATVTKREDGTIGPTAAFGINFSGGGDGPLVAMDQAGKKLALTWPGRLPEPVLGENTALYKSVLPDIDLKLIAKVDGFAQHLIVNTPQAAANPALKEIKLGITAQGVTLDDTASDELLAKDAGGQVIFSAPKPTMWQQPAPEAPAPLAKSATQAKSVLLMETPEPTAPQQADVGADVTANTLTLTPDPELLASATRFPLIIDPPFTGGTTGIWATVYSATPNSAYKWGDGWQSDNPADEPRVGYNGSGNTQAFFSMKLDGLKGATIGDVTFAVEQTHSWGCDPSAAGPTELWASKSIDATTPTWNTRNNFWTYKLAQGNFAHGNPTYCPGVQGYDFKSSALTSYVQDFVTNGWNPVAIGLRVPDSYLGNVNSFKRLRNNPVLEFQYYFKPEVIASGAFEGNWAPGADGNKPVPCSAMIGNSGLALTAGLQDRDGGTVTPEFVVTTAAGVAVPVSNVTTVASGGTATATVLAQNLPTGSYKWKVRARDDEGAYSPYTGDCAFSVDKTGPTARVTVTKEDGTALTPQQARTKMRVKLKNPANDLAGFCHLMDRPIPISSTPCAGANWVPLASGATEAVIDVIPTGRPQSTLYILAFDKAGNHSPSDGAADIAILKTTPASFIYPPGQSPLTKMAGKDLHGDLNGDGYTDMLATEPDGGLRLYASDGTGQVNMTAVGTSGWDGTLIAHGGDFVNLTSPAAAPDGYEDAIVRLKSNKLYIYPGTGRGALKNRVELATPSRLGTEGWARLQQIVSPGDMNQRTDVGYVQGNDLLTLECEAYQDGYCMSVGMSLYSGQTVTDGSADQREPFDLQANPTKIPGPIGGWDNHEVVTVGYMDGDGIKDIVTRDRLNSYLFLHRGRITNGVYSVFSENHQGAIYAQSGWLPDKRPLVASNGNAQGTVVSKSVNDDGTLIQYKEFQPKAGDQLSDIWATTPADPNYVVDYVDSTGTAATTTCPTGCLLFYAGGPTSTKPPLLVGGSGWATSIARIF